MTQRINDTREDESHVTPALTPSGELADLPVALPKTLRGQERRARILEVASQMFSQNGYNATSINDIVRVAGGSLATVYQWFGNKEGLFLALFQTHTNFVKDFFRSLELTGQGFDADIDLILTSICERPPLDLMRVALGEAQFFGKFTRQANQMLQDNIQLPLQELIERALNENQVRMCLDVEGLLNLIVRYIRGMFFEVVLSSEKYTERVAQAKSELKTIIMQLIVTDADDQDAVREGKA